MDPSEYKFTFQQQQGPLTSCLDLSQHIINSDKTRQFSGYSAVSLHKILRRDKGLLAGKHCCGCEYLKCQRDTLQLPQSAGKEAADSLRSSAACRGNIFLKRKHSGSSEEKRSLRGEEHVEEGEFEHRRPRFSLFSYRQGAINVFSHNWRGEKTSGSPQRLLDH